MLMVSASLYGEQRRLARRSWSNGLRTQKSGNLHHSCALSFLAVAQAFTFEEFVSPMSVAFIVRTVGVAVAVVFEHAGEDLASVCFLRARHLFGWPLRHDAPTAFSALRA